MDQNWHSKFPKNRPRPSADYQAKLFGSKVLTPSHVKLLTRYPFFHAVLVAIKIMLPQFFEQNYETNGLPWISTLLIGQKRRSLNKLVPWRNWNKLRGSDIKSTLHYAIIYTQPLHKHTTLACYDVTQHECTPIGDATKVLMISSPRWMATKMRGMEKVF